MKTLLATLLVTALASQAAAVPEPSTLLLSILGIAVFGMVWLVYQKVIMSAVLWESLILFSGRCGHLQINHRVLLALFWCTSTASILWIHSIACGQTQSFQLQEATVQEINDAFAAGLLTSEQLVGLYLNRIEAYDQQGPALNTIIEINSNALVTARLLDTERQESGPRSVLHGIPILLKDQLDTFDMPTTSGSLSLRDSIPPDDATIVQRLRDAGAIILGKTNLDEFACCSIGLSSLGGQTRNPYNITRIPGGSSAGTAAAIAANFAVIGTGSDTWGSIQRPASLQSLVGLMPTRSLISGDGNVPMPGDRRGVTGPMARTVADAAAMLDIIAGYDPADPVTEASQGQKPESYLDFLDSSALNGARVAMPSNFLDGGGVTQEILDLTNAAFTRMESLGATVTTVSFNTYVISSNYNELEFRMNRYLESLGPEAPYSTLQEIINSGEYLPSLDIYTFSNLNGDIPPEQDPDYAQVLAVRESYEQQILAVMDAENLDALVFPPLLSAAPTIESVQGTSGIWDRFSDFRNMNPSPFLGFPSITVPAGFRSDGMPFGIEFLGRPFSEPTLISLAYAYEQSTHHRQAPASTPPLPGETILAADFDIDGDVDGADFLHWQLNDGSETGLADWQANFGNDASSMTAASTTVPEPTTGLLLMLGVAVMLTGYNRL